MSVTNLRQQCKNFVNLPLTLYFLYESSTIRQLKTAGGGYTAQSKSFPVKGITRNVVRIIFGGNIL